MALEGTLADCADVHRRPAVRRQRGILYGSSVVALAVLLGLSFAGTYGVQSRTVRAEEGPLALTVRYGSVSRPALATPFDIEVRRTGGFDGPVTVAITGEYLRMWDENGLLPAPASETTEGPWLVWEFDPPEGDALRVTYDARIEPAAQEGRSGTVAVLDGDDEVVVEVAFTTRVWP